MPKAPISTTERAHLTHRIARPRENRPSASKRGYDAKWRAASEAFIAEQFAAGIMDCAICGKMLSSNRNEIHVDHRVRHQGQADPLFWDRTNWQMTHPSCHSLKTGRESSTGRQSSNGR